MRIIQPEANILPFNGDVLKHVERCGRIAYKSENAITEDSHVKFIQHLINRGHESVLEHGNYVFELPWETYKTTLYLYSNLKFEECAEKGYSARLRFSNNNNRFIVSGNIRAWRDFIRVIDKVNYIPGWMLYAFMDNPAFADLKLPYKEGEYKLLQRDDLTPEEQLIHWTETVHFVCSRAISHELVRHRALSPTQESQRFCLYSKDKFNGEITFIKPEYFTNNVQWRRFMKKCETEYMSLVEQGYSAQQAREVLPNSTKTELVMTGTIGEWVHFLNLRCADDAHPEMRRITKPLLIEFNHKYRICVPVSM